MATISAKNFKTTQASGPAPDVIVLEDTARRCRVRQWVLYLTEQGGYWARLDRANNDDPHDEFEFDVMVPAKIVGALIAAAIRDGYIPVTRL